MRTDPRLDEFLTSAGLGRHLVETTSEALGRNANVLVRTTAGHDLFVKRIVPVSDDARERFAACVAFDELVGRLRRDDPVLADTLGTAPLRAADPDLGFLAYDAVPGATSLAATGVDDHGEDAAHEHAEGIGRILAAVHGLDPAGVPARPGPPAMPPLGWLDELPWRIYQHASGPSLQIWHRLQRDPEVAEALRTLRADEDRRVARRAVPVHGDARLDQFLVGDDGALRLVDLEEFRAGDPARDVGAIVGEWLHRATLDIVGARSEADALADLVLGHDDVLTRGAEALDARRPVIARFVAAYGEASATPHDPGFVDRVTRFAGWHLFDRLLAAAENTARISAIHWAAAGIGRRALLDPAAAGPALGLPAAPDTRTDDDREAAA